MRPMFCPPHLRIILINKWTLILDTKPIYGVFVRKYLTVLLRSILFVLFVWFFFSVLFSFTCLFMKSTDIWCVFCLRMRLHMWEQFVSLLSELVPNICVCARKMCIFIIWRQLRQKRTIVRNNIAVEKFQCYFFLKTETTKTALPKYFMETSSLFWPFTSQHLWWWSTCKLLPA